MSTFRGHTRHVQVVTFRVSAAKRAELERDAAAAGISVNALAFQRTCEPQKAPEARVDTEESEGAKADVPRGLRVVYDSEVNE